MNDTEREILASLNQLDELARSMKTADPKPDLRPIFERLDQLTAQLGPRGDASLLHYMHKKSFEKARLYLEGRDPENVQGSCRH